MLYSSKLGAGLKWRVRKSSQIFNPCCTIHSFIFYQCKVFPMEERSTFTLHSQFCDCYWDTGATSSVAVVLAYQSRDILWPNIVRVSFHFLMHTSAYTTDQYTHTYPIKKLGNKIVKLSRDCKITGIYIYIYIYIYQNSPSAINTYLCNTPACAV